jgi:hypothetical protein
MYFNGLYTTQYRTINRIDNSVGVNYISGASNQNAIFGGSQQGNGNGAGYGSQGEFYIFNYTVTNKNKFTLFNSSYSSTTIAASGAKHGIGQWINTSAITDISLSLGGNPANNTTFYLYGVVA